MKQEKIKLVLPEIRLNYNKINNNFLKKYKIKKNKNIYDYLPTRRELRDCKLSILCKNRRRNGHSSDYSSILNNLNDSNTINSPLSFENSLLEDNFMIEKDSLILPVQKQYKLNRPFRKKFSKFSREDKLPPFYDNLINRYSELNRQYKNAGKRANFIWNSNEGYVQPTQKYKVLKFNKMLNKNFISGPTSPSSSIDVNRRNKIKSKCGSSIGKRNPDYYGSSNSSINNINNINYFIVNNNYSNSTTNNNNCVSSVCNGKLNGNNNELNSIYYSDKINGIFNRIVLMKNNKGFSSSNNSNNNTNLFSEGYTNNNNNNVSSSNLTHLYDPNYN